MIYDGNRLIEYHDRGAIFRKFDDPKFMGITARTATCPTVTAVNAKVVQGDSRECWLMSCVWQQPLASIARQVTVNLDAVGLLSWIQSVSRFERVFRKIIICSLATISVWALARGPMRSTRQSHGSTFVPCRINPRTECNQQLFISIVTTPYACVWFVHLWTVSQLAASFSCDVWSVQLQIRFRIFDLNGEIRTGPYEYYDSCHLVRVHVGRPGLWGGGLMCWHRVLAWEVSASAHD